jgi:hypothetical protein
MMSPHASWGEPRTRRIVVLFVSGLLAEAMLLGVVKLAPAMGVIMQPVYLVVGLIVIVAIWQSSRRRGDRRHGDRRDAVHRE